jgi:hypothetical protein
MVPSGIANSRLHITPELRDTLAYVDLAHVDDFQTLVKYVALVRGARFETDEDYLKFLDRTSAPRFGDEAEADAWLKGVAGAQFATDLQYELSRESFEPDSNLLYKVPLTYAFEPMVARKHDELVHMLEAKTLSPGRDAFLPYMWGASVILDKQDAPPRFFYAPAARPGARAVLADHYLRAEGDLDARGIITNTLIDVTKEPVLVGGDADAAGRFLGPGSASDASAGAVAPGTATVVADTGNVVTVDVDARKNAILFLADCWYPLIRATVDGADASVWPANYAYRAVPVPAGKHVVEFRYRPLDLYAGIAMTFAGIVALVAVARAWRRGARRAGGLKRLG